MDDGLAMVNMEKSMFKFVGVYFEKDNQKFWLSKVVLPIGFSK